MCSGVLTTMRRSGWLQKEMSSASLRVQGCGRSVKGHAWARNDI